MATLETTGLRERALAAEREERAAEAMRQQQREAEEAADRALALEASRIELRENICRLFGAEVETTPITIDGWRDRATLVAEGLVFCLAETASRATMLLSPCPGCGEHLPRGMAQTLSELGFRIRRADEEPHCAFCRSRNLREQPDDYNAPFADAEAASDETPDPFEEPIPPEALAQLATVAYQQQKARREEEERQHLIAGTLANLRKYLNVSPEETTTYPVPVGELLFGHYDGDLVLYAPCAACKQIERVDGYIQTIEDLGRLIERSDFLCDLCTAPDPFAE